MYACLVFQVLVPTICIGELKIYICVFVAFVLCVCYKLLVGFGPHNMLDRRTFRGRALADVLIKETEDSDEPIKVGNNSSQLLKC